MTGKIIRCNFVVKIINSRDTALGWISVVNIQDVGVGWVNHSHVIKHFGHQIGDSCGNIV